MHVHIYRVYRFTHNNDARGLPRAKTDNRREATAGINLSSSPLPRKAENGVQTDNRYSLYHPIQRKEQSEIRRAVAKGAFF